MAATLEYGLDKDGRMRYITEVANGIKCGCICPNPLCGQRLIAKNNPANIIALNFAHESGAECAGAKELNSIVAPNKSSVINGRSSCPIKHYTCMNLPNKKQLSTDTGRM